MERKGGCCIAPRYGAAAAAGQQPGTAWQMGKIMLKFRPIAPKPAAMASVPAPAAASGAGRGKRKAAGGGGGGRRGRKPKRAATVAPVAAAAAAAVPAVPAVVDSRKDEDCEKEKSLSSRSSSSSGITSVDSSPPPPPQQLPQPATLPLMPVSPVEEKPTTVAAAATGELASVVAAPPAGAQPVPPRVLRPVPPPTASWVTVEEITATWRDGEEAPSSAARCADGDGDAAPAFVSDQWGRVTWQNAAFSRAVSADDDSAAAVALAGALPAWGTCAGFTCRVRVGRHASTAAPRRSSVVAPCDVWRLDAAGCYLWRLDLQAALTLGGLP